jgi:NADH dehydrogenase [ubiquinone] 1 alpha subcomplex assembly factor 7
MFGEMVGAWFTDIWLQSGQPDRVQLIELGPGRGTLMADILRTLSNWPSLSEAVSVHLVETSPLLRQKQAETLKGCRPTWYDRLEDVPLGMSFIIANEFFDALPVHQFEKSGSVWMERHVAIDEKTGGFAFRLARNNGFDVRNIMPQDFLNAEDGSVFEISPASLSVMETIASRIAEAGGAGLIVDYGHMEPGLGDTAQAVENHAYASLLEKPGERDITAHVDFGTLKTVAAQAANVHGPVTQGEFLTRLGIMQRAEALRAKADEAQRRGLEQALFRLISPSAMGRLFKAMALTPRESTIAPAGFGTVEKDEIPDNGH